MSPGITPELVGLFVVELPILVGLAYAMGGRKGVELAFALNAVALGLVKLATDLSDLLDLPVALAGLAGGAAILRAHYDASWMWLPPVLLWKILGAAVLLVGAYKILRDFYDPFDLLLGDVCVVAGAWLLLGTVSRPGSRPRPGTLGTIGPTLNPSAKGA